MSKSIVRETFPAIAQVADYFKVPLRDLRGSSKARRVSRPRMVAMYLLRQVSELSYPEIGFLLGRDHSTVMSGIRKVTSLMQEKDQSICAAVAFLAPRLGMQEAAMEGAVKMPFVIIREVPHA